MLPLSELGEIMWSVYGTSYYDDVTYMYPTQTHQATRNGMTYNWLGQGQGQGQSNYFP